MTERLRAIITHSNSNPNRASEFFRFRKSLFVDQLGWQLEVSADEERDQFEPPPICRRLQLPNRMEP